MFFPQHITNIKYEYYAISGTRTPVHAVQFIAIRCVTVTVCAVQFIAIRCVTVTVRAVQFIAIRCVTVTVRAVQFIAIRCVTVTVCDAADWHSVRPSVNLHTLSHSAQNQYSRFVGRRF